MHQLGYRKTFCFTNFYFNGDSYNEIWVSDYKKEASSWYAFQVYELTKSFSYFGVPTEECFSSIYNSTFSRMHEYLFICVKKKMATHV